MFLTCIILLYLYSVFFFFFHIFNKKVTNLEKTSINMSCDTQCEKSNCSLWKRVSDCHIILQGGQCLVGTNLMVTFLSVFHKICHGTDKKHTITIKLPLYIKTAQATCYECIIYTRILLWVCCVYRFCKLCWIVTWRKKIHVSGSFLVAKLVLCAITESEWLSFPTLGITAAGVNTDC